MSEESLRELERRWRASGDPQDERRWLTARARAGELVMLCLPLGEDAYRSGEQELIATARALLAALDGRPPPPTRRLSRTVGPQRDLGQGAWEQETVTRLGEKRRGLEVRRVVSGASDGLTPSWHTVTVEAFGLARGSGLRLNAGLSAPAYGHRLAATLTVSGRAPRVAAVAALARERYAAEEPPRPA